MNKSELIDKVNQTGSYFFSKDNLRFFGDSRSNYYLSRKIHDVNGVNCYKLSRRKAVNGGLKAPAYFDVDSFKKIIKRGES